MNLDQLIAVLDAAAKHWTIKCVNSRGRRRYECTVWMLGRRVSADRISPFQAIEAAMNKAKNIDQRGLKVVR